MNIHSYTVDVTHTYKYHTHIERAMAMWCGQVPNFKLLCIIYNIYLNV